MTPADLLATAGLLPGAEALLREHAAELPQQDQLCGPFCAVLALRAAGFRDLTQEEVARVAGSTRSAPGTPSSLPPGERGRPSHPALPVAADPMTAGTSASGLATALDRLSTGALAAVPASGNWRPAALDALLDGAATLRDGLVAVIANVATAHWWDPGVPAALLTAYLRQGESRGAADAPRSRWRVRHLVTLAGLVQGQVGRLVVVADSYPSLGVGGVHLQPRERMVESLHREGMPPGGILLVVRSGASEAARRVVSAAGLSPVLWDNGSPASPRSTSPRSGSADTDGPGSDGADRPPAAQSR